MTNEETTTEDDDIIAYERTIQVGPANPMLAVFGDAPVFDCDVAKFDEVWEEFEALSLDELWDYLNNFAEEIDRRPKIEKRPTNLTRCEMITILSCLRERQAARLLQGPVVQ